MKNRFTPYLFPNGARARNRVVVPPMASQTADPHGFVTEATVNHYRRLARSGAAIVFVEYSFVHPSGRSEERQLGAHRDEAIFGLSAVAAAIHGEGALAGLQIVHAGGKSVEAISGGPLQAPSAVKVPVHGWEADLPNAMSRAQIDQWIEWFGAAAERARKAGFDIVEIHAAHGYGLNQWLSPLTNRRSDEFGGTSIAKRLRLVREIATAVKAAGLITAARLPGQDHLQGGLTPAEMQWAAAALPLDLVDVSSGIGGWRRPERRQGQGYLIPDAQRMKAHLPGTPVIGVGGIETGSFIDELIVEEAVDFAAVGRALLRDPEAWGARHLAESLQSTIAKSCVELNVC